MSNWLNRSGYVMIAAFLGGAVIAAFVVILVVVLRDGDEDNDASVVGEATAPPAGQATVAATPTDGPAATATPGAFDNPDDALAAFVRGEFAEPYIGPCPDRLAAGEQPPAGWCSIELYRSAELATFNLGYFGTEATGEAVITPKADGDWSLVFLPFPRLDLQITLGADAMVFQASDCLRFRTAPTTSATVTSCQIDGTRASVAEGPVEADGQTWWRLAGYGWASSSFLAPALE